VRRRFDSLLSLNFGIPDVNARLKKIAQYLISLVLMFFFLYWAFREVDPAVLWGTIVELPLFWVAAIVLTTLCTMVLRSWRWVVLMRPFAPQVTVRDASLALAICYSANVAIPRSGEALRAISLKWTRGTSISSVLATVVVERILDLIWLSLFLGVSLLLLRERINQAFPLLEPLGIIALIGSLLGLVFLAFISFYRERALFVIERLLSKVSPRFAGKIIDLLGTFLNGLQALHSPAAYLEIVASSLLLNLGYTAIIYEAFIGFNFTHTFNLGLEAALVIMTISSIGVIFPTPGSAGTYHAFFGQALVHLYAMDTNAALACATAVHAIANLTYLTLGGPALFWQWRRARRDSEAGEPAPEDSDK
jgi:glycosyltransferase 2 family protein